MSLIEFDYRRHVRDGGKLTLQEFKQRRRAKYKRQGIALLKFERELKKKLKRQRAAKEET